MHFIGIHLAVLNPPQKKPYILYTMNTPPKKSDVVSLHQALTSSLEGGMRCFSGSIPIWTKKHCWLLRSSDQPPQASKTPDLPAWEMWGGCNLENKGHKSCHVPWVEMCALNLYTVTTYCSQNPLLPWIYLSLQSFSHVILYLHFAEHKPHISWQPSHLT